MSLCELFLEAVVSEAKVFARVRKRGVFGECEVIGEVGDGREKVGFAGDGFEDVSELKE